MPVVLTGHIPFFLPDLSIVFVQLGGLRFGQCAILDSLVDPALLVREPLVDLRAARVILLPGCFSVKRGYSYAHDEAADNHESCDFPETFRRPILLFLFVGRLRPW
jgi:hypothetical protein